MERQRQALGFEEKDFSWDLYSETRPRYPDSLFDILYRYHEAGAWNDSWEVAMDVGAGHGIISERLARRFRRVLVCEPNEEYLENAQSRLKDTEGRFEFHCHAAEDTFLPPGTVDMVVMAECIHWTDIPTVLNAAATHLKPGGTLALTYYGLPFLVDNKEAAKVWDELWDAVLDVTFCGPVPAAAVTERSLRTENSGYDCIDIPPEMYSDIRRIKMNASDSQAFFFSNKHDRSFPSAVRNTDILEKYDNVDDWKIAPVDATWLMRLVKSYTAGLEVFDAATATRFARMLESALASSAGVATVVHPVSIILATRL